MRLAGLNALVTGGASGFGRGIAEAYAREGASVMIADLDEAAADEVAVSINELGGSALSIAADITNEASMKAAVAATEAAFGGLSTLVANAGIGQRPMRATETPVDEMQRQFTVNALGAAISCQAAVLHTLPETSVR